MARKDGKSKLVVVTDLGEFSRTTARGYAFLMVSRGINEASVARMAASNMAAYRNNLRYEREIEAAGPTHPHWALQQGANDAERAAYNRECIALNEARLAEGVEAEAQRIREEHAARGWAASWTSRYDLARKSMDSALAFSAEARIYDLAGKRCDPAALAAARA